MSKLLKIEDLRVEFRTHADSVKAVDGISYGVEQGETVALVGESGCGKSMSALAVMGLVPPPSRTSGSVWFQGVDLLGLSEDQLRDVRGRDIAMVFQEPMTSLNPVLTIQTQLVEGMRRHLGLSKASAGQRATHLLRMVGIAEPERRMKQYPHHFSGGMRQRVMIAMALSCNPKLIIADEPTTALDVTIQAQILELIKELTQRLGVALVLITHNLGAVARYADRVNVMYAGRLVEAAPTAELYARSRHPYTIGLMNSVPRMTTQRGARLIPIEGLPPDLSCLDGTCAYRPRCRWAIARCAEAFPPLEPVGPDHRSACFRSHEL